MKTTVDLRKIHFVQDFLRIQNEEIIKKFEKLLKTERLHILDAEFSTPMSIEKFNKLIDEAESDVANGRLTNHEVVKKNIRNW